MINYDIEEFCCEYSLIDGVIGAMFAVQDFNESDYSSVAIICKEDLAERIFKALCKTEVNGFEFDISYLDFDKEDYESEYAVILDTFGSLSIDKVYFDSGELKVFGEDTIFISDECNSKILINQFKYDDEAVFAFSITEECE